MAAVLIIAGGYMILNKDKSTESPGSSSVSSNNPEGKPYTEPYSENATGNKPADSNERVTGLENDPGAGQSTNITQNAKPSFNVGDRLVYSVPLYGQEGFNCKLEQLIADRVRLNGTEYFRVRQSLLEGCIIGIDEVDGHPMHSKPWSVTRLYINVDTGQESSQLGTPNAVTLSTDPNRCADVYAWFCPWMLKLDDNFKWYNRVVEEFGSEQYEGYSYSSEEMSVKGREKIDGRECFKVEHTYKICLKDGSCKIDFKVIFYVDTEKRILVKRDAWQGNLYRGEVKLIDQSLWKNK
jgi:hypothetical protein